MRGKCTKHKSLKVSFHCALGDARYSHSVKWLHFFLTFLRSCRDSARLISVDCGFLPSPDYPGKMEGYELTLNNINTFTLSINLSIFCWFLTFHFGFSIHFHFENEFQFSYFDRWQWKHWIEKRWFPVLWKRRGTIFDFCPTFSIYFLIFLSIAHQRVVKILFTSLIYAEAVMIATATPNLCRSSSLNKRSNQKKLLILPIFIKLPT